MSTTGLKRNTIDKYYTKSKIVDLCIQLIKDNLFIKSNDLIIEPSAGNGAFITQIKNLTTNYIFLDIQPENSNIIQLDYLTFTITELNNLTYENIHVIGNPPFGRQSSLAIKFIKKSSEYADSISFILPKSFKKDSMKNKIPLNFHLIVEYDLPDNAFLIDGNEIDVPCIFQIWKKKDYNREIEEKLEPNNYIFVKKNNNPDVSFRRVGINAGIISQNIDNKSIESHYFIKFTNNKKIEDNLLKLLNIKFKFNNTVGPKSISKQELIKEFNKYL